MNLGMNFGTYCSALKKSWSSKWQIIMGPSLYTLYSKPLPSTGWFVS